VPENPNLGWVTTLEKVDLPIVARAMLNPEKDLNSAGVLPPTPLVQRFSSYFPPGTPFSYILIRLNEISRLHSRFHICGLKDQVEIADVIHPVQNLTINDRLMFSNAPAPMRYKAIQQFIKECAICVAEQRGGNILEIPSLSLDLLDKEVVGERSYLHELEILHKNVILYLWLTFRFPGIFTTRPLATHIKEIIEENIEKTLKLLSFNQDQRKKDRMKLRQAALLSELEQDVLINSEDEVDKDTVRAGLVRAEDNQQTTSAELNVGKPTGTSEMTGLKGILNERRIEQESETWDEERGYAIEEAEAKDGTELNTKAGSERIFEDVSTDTTPLDTEEEVESVKDPKLMDDQLYETASDISGSRTTSGFSDAATSADTSIFDEPTKESKVTECSSPAWRDQTTEAPPAAESKHLEALLSSKIPSTTRNTKRSNDLVIKSPKPTTPLPFQPTQPSSSEELSKLIAAQQHRQ
jgi:hypothetical protein